MPPEMQRMVSEEVERQMQGMKQQQEKMQQEQEEMRELIDYAPVLEKLNRPVVAIGANKVRTGSGSFLELNGQRGLIVTCHHALMGAGWDSQYNETSPFTVDIGQGADIAWGRKAVVLAHFPSPKKPSKGMPDHQSGNPLELFDMALLKLVDDGSSLLTDIPHLEWSSDVKVGDKIDLLGYGQQNSGGGVRHTLSGNVTSVSRLENNLGCRVIDIQGDMLSGHSGGPVVNRRTRKVIGICISSQYERAIGKVWSMSSGVQAPVHDYDDAPMHTTVQVSTGGLHTVVPIEHVEKLYQRAFSLKLQQ